MSSLILFDIQDGSQYHLQHEDGSESFQLQIRDYFPFTSNNINELLSNMKEGDVAVGHSYFKYHPHRFLINKLESLQIGISGTLKQNETDIDGLEREVQEEAGFSMKDIDILSTERLYKKRPWLAMSGYINSNVNLSLPVKNTTNDVKKKTSMLVAAPLLKFEEFYKNNIETIASSLREDSIRYIVLFSKEFLIQFLDNLNKKYPETADNYEQRWFNRTTTLYSFTSSNFKLFI